MDLLFEYPLFSAMPFTMVIALACPLNYDRGCSPPVIAFQIAWGYKHEAD